MTEKNAPEEEMVFEIGTHVYCTDGRCGKLAKVVINPGTNRVTDLIIERGSLQKKDRVLPVSLVGSTDKEGIQLRISSEKLTHYPEYHEEEFRVPAPEWAHEWYDRSQVSYWMLPYGALAETDPLLVPMVRQKVYAGLPSHREVIGHGTPVHDGTHRIGIVDHLLVNRKTRRITHLVIHRPGIRPAHHTVPMDKVQEVDDDGVYLKLSKEELASLPIYVPRG